MPLELKSVINNLVDMVSKPSGNILINPFITSILIVSFILFLLFLFGESDSMMLKVGVWGGIFTTIVLFYHSKAIKTEIENKNNYNNETIEGGDIDLAAISPTVSGGSRGGNKPPLLPSLRSCPT